LRLITSALSLVDRSDEFRAASECLRLAHTTSDDNTRAALLIMAQKWFDLANGPPSQGALDAAVRAFNDWQLSPQFVTQQRQPNKDG
jgi:hypothetical protein